MTFDQETVRLGFLGCGQMGQAILSGLLESKICLPSEVMISAKNSAEKTASRFGVKAVGPVELLQRCEVIFLGIKPYQLHLTQAWVKASRAVWKERACAPLLFSMLAGTNFIQLREQLGKEMSLVRIMPNLPAQVKSGVTLVCAESHSLSAADDLQRSTELLSPLGHVELLNTEHEFHAATAISGCGPAYLFNVIEALADAGVHEGLKRDVALRLAAHTVYGSGALAIDEHPAILKDRVTSPGGVTIAGVRSLERSGLRTTMIEAVIEASNKSREMERSH